MDIQIVPQGLTLGDLERSNQRHRNFEQDFEILVINSLS